MRRLHLTCKLRRGSRAIFLSLLAVGCLAGTSPVPGAELEEIQKLQLRGEYARAAEAASAAARSERRTEDWRLLQADALTAIGRYREAREAIEEGLRETPFSIRLRLAAFHLFRQNGDPQRARQLLEELYQITDRRLRTSQQPPDQIAIGKAALLVGADPKRVLELFFSPVKKAQPEFRESYLASGDLALDKSDFSLAAKLFTEAARKFSGDPEVQFGLARAYESSDTGAMLKAVEQTLKGNPNHTGAYLLLANHHIDAEQYEQADIALAKVLEINPAHPRAHALRAVLAELRGNTPGIETARAAALQSWAENPEVDSLIGLKFSQKYRFAEGAQHQRQALEFDPEYLPAKAQLAQDLLRLGQDEEGWKLAQEVQEADPYNVVAYNLVTLRESLAKFQTLTSKHFLVRMDPKEAEVYGQRVLDLLERAQEQLGKKYGMEPKEKTIVEIFPDQKDFAIRTFGLPGGAGYLGVCFGRLITANSPAARPGSATNWEAVLWHEYCHVVTLQLTRNRMPRWLSEGISVYEERQARGTWGEQMKPRYRAMILGEDLTPVSRLSGAFLKPKTPLHLQFAYYESSLVVEYLLERFGLDAMKRIFADLGTGIAINDALAKHAAPLEQIDREFAERAQALARNTGPRLDWSQPEPAKIATEAALRTWVKENPDNYSALMEDARHLLEERQWEAAKVPLRKVIELYPEQHEGESAYTMLARAHRELSETEEEFATLQKVATLSSEAPEAYGRLMELSAIREDWPAVTEYAAQFEAVDPLSPLPHRYAGQALETLGQDAGAISRYRTLLNLNPANPSDTHYRLAKLLHKTGQPEEARRHVLQALEEAPRFRDALTLLLQMQGTH